MKDSVSKPTRQYRSLCHVSMPIEREWMFSSGVLDHKLRHRRMGWEVQGPLYHRTSMLMKACLGRLFIMDGTFITRYTREPCSLHAQT